MGFYPSPGNSVSAHFSCVTDQLEILKPEARQGTACVMLYVASVGSPVQLVGMSGRRPRALLHTPAPWTLFHVATPSSWIPPCWFTSDALSDNGFQNKDGSSPLGIRVRTGFIHDRIRNGPGYSAGLSHHTRPLHPLGL